MPAGKSLRSRLVRRGIFGQSGLVVVLFIPADTLKFRQGHAFTTVNLISAFAGCVYTHLHNPQWLERGRLTGQKALPGALPGI